jgi:hypothetical protein
MANLISAWNSLGTPYCRNILLYLTFVPLASPALEEPLFFYLESISQRRPLQLLVAEIASLLGWMILPDRRFEQFATFLVLVLENLQSLPGCKIVRPQTSWGLLRGRIFVQYILTLAYAASLNVMDIAHSYSMSFRQEEPYLTG